MEKELNIIKMEKFVMRDILIMANMKEMKNYIMIMEK